MVTGLHSQTGTGTSGTLRPRAQLTEQSLLSRSTGASWRLKGSHSWKATRMPDVFFDPLLEFCTFKAFLNAAWTAAMRNRTYPILCKAHLSGGHHICMRAHIGRHSEEELYLGKQGDPWRLTAWLSFHHIKCTCTTSLPSLRPGKKARRKGLQGGILATMTPCMRGENWPASYFSDVFY